MRSSFELLCYYYPKIDYNNLKKKQKILYLYYYNIRDFYFIKKIEKQNM